MAEDPDFPVLLDHDGDITNNLTGTRRTFYIDSWQSCQRTFESHAVNGKLELQQQGILIYTPVQVMLYTIQYNYVVCCRFFAHAFNISRNKIYKPSTVLKMRKPGSKRGNGSIRKSPKADAIVGWLKAQGNSYLKHYHQVSMRCTCHFHISLAKYHLISPDDNRVILPYRRRVHKCCPSTYIEFQSDLLCTCPLSRKMSTSSTWNAAKNSKTILRLISRSPTICGCPTALGLRMIRIYPSVIEPTFSECGRITK
jgi:hypothetical protein